MTPLNLLRAATLISLFGYCSVVIADDSKTSPPSNTMTVAAKMKNEKKVVSPTRCKLGRRGKNIVRFICMDGQSGSLIATGSNNGAVFWKGKGGKTRSTTLQRSGPNLLRLKPLYKARRCKSKDDECRCRLIDEARDSPTRMLPTCTDESETRPGWCNTGTANFDLCSMLNGGCADDKFGSWNSSARGAFCIGAAALC